MKTAYIFPAFVPEYLGIEPQVIGEEVLFHKLMLAAEFTGIDLATFHAKENTFIENALASQYITYIMSCCVSDSLSKLDRKPDYIASFSMGMYAALYHCRCFSFEDGLLLIRNAFSIIEQSLPEEAMGMCVIGGLGKDDIDGIMRSHIAKVEVVNQNSEFSFILSGYMSNLENILLSARQIGAMQTRLLPVHHPYHASFIATAAVDFGAFLNQISIAAPEFTFISSLDQRQINSVALIKKELERNLHQPFAWMKTFQWMLSQGVNTFIECGGGESLYKIGKFFEGDFTILNCKRINKYLHA